MNIIINKIKKLLKLCVFITIILTLSGCKKNVTNESFIKSISDINSYALEGTLTTYFPSGEKVSKVLVNYNKPNYYVELTNPETNHNQILIKNNDGVHIIVSNIKKSFKINSTWPNNSTYPYIIESISKELLNDDVITEQIDDYTVFITSVHLFNENYTETLKVYVDKNNNLKEITLTDKDNNLMSKFIITKFEKNINIDSSIFNVSETFTYLENNEFDFSLDRYITYPTYQIEGTYKESEVIRKLSLDTYAIMTFSGSVDYTIVEQYVHEDSVIPSEYSGSIFTFLECFCIVNSNNVVFYNNGIEYKIASNNLDIFELIKIGESLIEENQK